MKEKKPLSKFQMVIVVGFVISTVVLFFLNMRQDALWVRLGDEVLHVLVSDTPQQQFKGLSDRKDLGKYDGMLFIFDTPKRAGIVMRDMRFPLDIIWIGSDLRIVDIAQNVQLETGDNEENLTVYYPRTEVPLVLEVPAGFVQGAGLQIGDTLSVIETP
jgi:uncharacterized membrane protein (UPF0127 family)